MPITNSMAANSNVSINRRPLIATIKREKLSPPSSPLPEVETEQQSEEEEEPEEDQWEEEEVVKEVDEEEEDPEEEEEEDPEEEEVEEEEEDPEEEEVEEEEVEEREEEDHVNEETNAIPAELEKQEPQILKSIDELSSLSDAIRTFKSSFFELKKHIDLIGVSIDNYSKELSLSSNQLLSGIKPVPKQPQNEDQSLPKPITSPKEPETKVPTENQETKAKAMPEVQTVNEAMKKEQPKSEVQILCKNMSFRDLRRYIVNGLSNTAKLRYDVPAALRFAPKPARLVLDCVGRFYLQGTKAYRNDSPLIPTRKAAILVLEHFLLMMDNRVEIETGVKSEAEEGAVAWRKRLISEGGLSRALEIDARGLILYLACFGFPSTFTDDDVWQLIRLTDLSRIFDALRRSHILVARMSGIFYGMMKKGIRVEAVDIAYALGIDDKFSPRKILTSFLHESKETYKRNKQDANNSLRLMNEANKKQLAALNAVVKCLEGRRIDPVKILPGWQVQDKIISLEKEIADLDLKLKFEKVVKAKRKMGNDTFTSPGAKRRSRFSHSPIISPLAKPESRSSSHLENKGSYADDLMPRSWFNHNNSYPGASSLLYGKEGAYIAGRGDTNGQSYNWQSVGEPDSGDRSFRAKHTSIDGFCKASKGFIGQLSSSTSSDLYSFADGVREDNDDSRQSAPMKRGVPPAI